MTATRPAPRARPYVRILAGYQRSWLPIDLLAGFTVWAIAVPEVLAYASIAGVPPVVGLYAVPAALVAYALLGGSRHLVVAPMSATAALSAATVLEVAGHGDHSGDVVALTAGLAVAVGAVCVLAAVLRLGYLATFISGPVLQGFVTGLALTIAAGQVPKLLGIHSQGDEFFARVWHLLADLEHTHGASLLVGLASLVSLVVLHELSPRLPGALVVVLASIGAAHAFGLEDHGVAVVGVIDAGLPPLGLPDLAWGDYVALAAGAVGLALVGFTQGLGAVKPFAAPAGDLIEPNRELLATGVANLAAGASSGMVVSGSLSKTAVNAGAGARSPVSGLVAAAMVVVTLLFLTGLFEALPEPTLAAVVIVAIVELIHPSTFRRLARFSSEELRRIYGPAARPDLVAALAALAGVLVLGTLPGLFLGVAISVLLIVYRASRPHVAVLGRVDGERHWVDLHREPGATTVDGVVVLRPEGGLFYANAESVRREITRHVAATTRGVVIDASSVPDVDLSAVEMLGGLAEELAARDVRLVIARGIGQVRDLLDHAAVSEEAVLYPSVDAAIAALDVRPGDDVAHP